MAYPPASLPADRTNDTVSFDTHPGAHNDSERALNDVVAELGTNPSGASPTVQARLDSHDAGVDAHHAQNHTTRHQSGGADALPHASLPGIGPDDHHAQNHATRHQSGGADALPHASLPGIGPDDHHARSHDHAAAADGSTLSPAALNIPAAVAPAQTAEGQAVWDSDGDRLTVGDGVGRKSVMNQADVAGGELGGTYPNPTVAVTHSGSAHHAKTHGAPEHAGDVIPDGADQTLGAAFIEFLGRAIPASPAVAGGRVFFDSGLEQLVARVFSNVEVPLYSAPGPFGDGSDGTRTLSSGGAAPPGMTAESATVFRMDRDVFYEALTVNSGITLKTNGYRLYVRRKLTVTGTVRNNGGNGGTPTGGAGAPGGSLGGGAVGGGGGVAAVAGSAGGNASDSLGGAGLAGDAGGGGGGGAGGGVTAPAANAGSPRTLPFAAMGHVIGNGAVVKIQGGAGGGGGAGGALGEGSGGGGGGGGGLVVVCARHIAGTGTIQAAGGLGGAPGTNGGAGGSGGGGVVIAVYSDRGTSLTFSGGAVIHLRP